MKESKNKKISVAKVHTMHYFCNMKLFDWNDEKNEELKKARKISFEDVLFCYNNDGLLDILKHPNKEKYSNQKIFVFDINNYIYYVPFVENEDVIFLKTIIPSRKLTKQYLGDKNEK